MIREQFFVIGAQRSGTSYLYTLLQEHPEIEMARPARPEPKFFLLDDLYERGLAYYRDQYFSAQPSARLFGEKSTSYIESEKAARRIARCFPDARIIAILRDPIERAISNYRFSRENGLETSTLSEAIMREEDRRDDYDRERISVSPFAYLRRGIYVEYLDMYGRIFPVERIKILLFEDFVGSLDLVRDLWAFLGVDVDFCPPSLDDIVNAGRDAAVTLSPELVRYMVGYFAEPNARLAQRYGLDLHAWQKW